MDKAPKINGFEILEMLPRGGMSTVYKARQISLDRIVALKTLPPTLAHDAADIEKFIFEARITASLKHPNIVQVYDFGQSEEGIYYFVMEFVSGYSVASWIRRKQVISEENSLLVAQSVAEALKYAWEREKVIHCDIKPDNVIVDSDGTIKVADLGLAKSILSVADGEQDDAVFGTPNYISPEQSRGDTPLDCRADIYSLGASLYHCVTGKMPFDGQPPMEVMDLQCTDTIADTMDLNPDLSTGMACLIEKMMAKAPDARQPDWSVVIRDIIQVRSEKLPAGDFRRIFASTVRRGKLREQHLQDIYRLLEQKEVPRSDGLPERRYLNGFWLANRKQPRARPRVAAVAGRGRMYEKIAAGGLLVVAILLTGLIMRHFRRPAAEPDVSAPVEHHAMVEPDDTASAADLPDDAAEADAREQLARDLFDATMQWLTENSGQYDEAIAKFEELANVARGTRYAPAALEEIQKLQQTRQRAVGQLMRDLRDEAERLGQREQFQEAAAVFTNYTGSLASITQRQRERQAAEWQKLADQHREERQTRLAQQEQAWNQLLTQTAAALLDGQQARMLNRIRQALEDNEFPERRQDLWALDRLTATAGQLEQRLLVSFQRQKGQTVELQFVDGTETLTIGEVSADVIKADEVIKLGAGYAIRPREFTLRDLDMYEKQKRLQTTNPQETALLKGLLAVREEDYHSAELFFAAAGAPLAEPLSKLLRRRRATVTEQAALLDFRQLLMRARIGIDGELPDPDNCLRRIEQREFTPAEMDFLRRSAGNFLARHGHTELASQYRPVLERLGRSRAPDPPPPPPEDTDILGALLRQNAGMRSEEIETRTDESNGALTRLVIISPSLRNIQALAGAAQLRELVCGGKNPDDHTETVILAPLTDISPLRRLPLRHLSLAFTRVRDVAPLASNSDLVQLNLRQTEVVELASLAGLSLQDLNISGTGVRDLAALRYMPLRRLDISRTEVRDIAVLRGKPLVMLNAGRSRIRDLAPLSGMALDRLDVSHTEIRDLAPLSGMPLSHLNLAGTRIRDLAHIHGMPLQRLELTGTDVTDLLPLRGMPLRALNITRTPVRDLSPLQYAPIEQIWLDFDPLRQRRDTDRAFGEVLRRMPALRSINGVERSQLFEQYPRE